MAFKTVRAPRQDIIRGDVSCQTHFFRGGGEVEGVAKLHLVGALLVGALLGGGGASLPSPALNPTLS